MEKEGIVRKTGGYDPPDPGDIFNLDNMAIWLRGSQEECDKWEMEKKKQMDDIISNFDLMRAKLATEARSQAYLADIKKLNQENKAYFARLKRRVNMDIIAGKITILPNQVVEQSIQLKAQNVQLPTQGADQVKLTDGVRSVLSCVENIPKFQQEPANLSVLDPNSNPYEPMFNPSVVEGEGVRLGSSSKMDSNLSSLEKGGVMTEIRNMKFADSNPKVCNVQLSTDGKKEDFTIGMKDNVFTLLNTGSLNNVKVGCGSSYEPPDPGDKVSKYTPNVNGKKDNVFALLNTGGVNNEGCGSSYEPPDPGDNASKYTPNVTDSLNIVKEGCGSSYEPPDPGDQAGKGYASLYDSPDPLITRPTNGFLKEGCDLANSETTFELSLSMNGSSYEPPDPGDQANKGYASLYASPDPLITRPANDLDYDRDKGVMSLDKKIGVDYDRDKVIKSLGEKIGMVYDKDKGEIYQPISIPFGCYFSPGKYLEYIDEFPPRYISCKGGG
jgi:hypothetical protein